jgi:hypothetical protein
MKFPSWHMDYCGKIDGPSYDTLMNRDDYCGEWEPKAECGGCQYLDGNDGRCRNPESEYYGSTRHGGAGCDGFGEWIP